ncbi:MAG TPA: hypothetical protein VKV24_06755 [Casimicrobiaceae bacterium]|nr:hypothetical protein [Casimicrobiaceae bacterium]
MDEPVRNPTIAKVADQAHAATDRVAEKATGAITAARDSVHNSVDSVAKRADAVRQGPNDLLEAGAEYIRARPYAAVGFALALGYLVGRLRS